MLGSIPIISPAFQFLLNSIGWVLAEIYKYIPNYGASIVILTLALRFILVPLAVKQIKSMQNMQALQPKIKDLQKKYKGNKAKLQEEQMKLYKDHGVNPLGGCLPMLLQFPFLIAMYAVIRMPMMQPVPASPAKPASYVVMNNHLPVDSQLFHEVITHQNTGLFILNLQCSAAQSGTQAVIDDTTRAHPGHPVLPGLPLRNGRDLGSADPGTAPIIPGVKSSSTIDCGSGAASKIPYFVMLLFMVATTYYQQRQMQSASPPGAAGGQQQAIMRIMPLMFGVFGYLFPAGLVLYWSVANVFQISQQYLLFRAGHIGPEALERQIAEQRAKNAGQPAKKGFMSRMMEQAQEQRGQQPPRARGNGQGGAEQKGPRKPLPPKGGGSTKGGAKDRAKQPRGTTGGGNGKSGSGGAKSGGSATPPRPAGPRRRPNTGPKKRPGGSDGASD
jgi:YidC/Oxa1 family membrane protein insertase